MTREAAIKWKKEIEAFQEGKTIQIKNSEWQDVSDPAFYLTYEYRIKPEPIKRLPTIEEVEKWFLENKVFRDKGGMLGRISTIDKDSSPIRINGDYHTIEEFCKYYTHLDGTELYITEN